ncbi:hypothetical protein KZ829_06635 [Actinoplanes hulinensis]|uniref:Uncharacterized protein n=1 Tax=Actinoplanes hulinensis TaxID=1144547 RepID=A0ABS7AZ19_9ACTN|nr:hypothetical protein [Actinoplanes hulinensis]MBW6433419.1 hypothetical protein [Actinoplanes hulinensis]
MTEYDHTPAYAFQPMLDPANGLAPGRPATGMRASAPAFQAGGEGPRWEGRQGPGSASTGTVLLLDVLQPS